MICIRSSNKTKMYLIVPELRKRVKWIVDKNMHVYKARVMCPSVWGRFVSIPFRIVFQCQIWICIDSGVTLNITQTFQDYGLLSAFKNSLIPVTCDSALITAMEKLTPLAVSCAVHNMSNEIKRVTTVNAMKHIPIFEEEFKKISKFINSCDHSQTRDDPNCEKSYNNFIWDLKPTLDQAKHIARYFHVN